jgi:predicted HNH restriction endonuclease
MGKKLPYTPNSKIRAALRLLWMRSRERAKALKSTSYCCAECGVKQSVAKGREVKLEVHHTDGIDWDGIFDLIRERLLNVPQKPLCKDCHAKAHKDIS